MGQSISKSHYKTKTFLLRFFKILVYPTWDENIDVCRIFNQNTSAWLGWKIQCLWKGCQSLTFSILLQCCQLLVENTFETLYLLWPILIARVGNTEKTSFCMSFSMQERVMVSLESNWIFIWNWKAFKKHDYLKNLVILHPICK